MDEVMPIQEFIVNVPLFSSLPPEETRRLAETLNRVEVPAKVVLFSEGEPCDRFSIIVEGRIEIIKALGTAEERILAIQGPGDFLGEMSLLYSDGLRSASARTHSPVQMLEMTHTDFTALLNRHPVLALEMLRELIFRLRTNENLTIYDLQEKNRQLAEAYQELKAAQVQLVEKEKMEHELRMARKIQESILPKELPVIPGWVLAAHWQPARAVSGDFYDFITYPDGKLAVLMGDVTDKGVPAALVMATTRSVLRTAAKQWTSPAQVLAQVNNVLCQDMVEHMFVTCLYALLDPATGEVHFANAGHNLPYQLTSHGPIELRATGMPLGLLPDLEYEEKETRLSPGESLMLYTDGLVEAHNPTGEMFGYPRLRDLLAERAGSEAGAAGGELIHFLLGQMAAFTGPAWEQEDDITFVTLERT